MGGRDSHDGGHAGGAERLLRAPDDLLPKIGSVTINGVTGQTYSFMDSTIAGWTIGKVNLKDVQFDTPSSTDAFGVAAYTISSYTRKTGKVVSYKWPTQPASAWPTDNQDDFQVEKLTIV